MEYRIHLKDAIKAIFISKNPFATVIMSILFLSPLFILLIYVPEEYTIGVLLTVVLPMGVLALTNVNSGWSIEGDTLRLKAFTVSGDIPASSMEIGIVHRDREWRPVLRTFGAGLPGLLMGRCRLKNKESATVFWHMNHAALVVIHANEKYYLIGHPGVEKLYDTLISLGAKAREF